RLLNLLAHPDPGDAVLAWYLEPARVPDVLRRTLADGTPGHEPSMNALRALVEEELAVLEPREARLRMTIEEPDRAGASGRAVLLSGEDGARWLRYERMHDGSVHRAYKALLKGGEES